MVKLFCFSKNDTSSNDIRTNEYSINLTLLKRIGFYQIVDPGSPKAFGINIFILINMLMIVVSTAVALTGFYGFTSVTNNPVHNIYTDVQVFSSLTFFMIANLRIITIIKNADKMFNLLKILHRSFLSNKLCKNSFDKQVRCGTQFANIFYPLYLIAYFLATILWGIVPLVRNMNVDDDIQNIQNFRKNNVINIYYLVSGDTYNKYFSVFYVIEFIITAYCSYVLVIFDLFITLILQMITVQYEIVSTAYAKLEINADNDCGELYNNNCN